MKKYRCKECGGYTERKCTICGKPLCEVCKVEVEVYYGKYHWICPECAYEVILDE